MTCTLDEILKNIFLESPPSESRWMASGNELVWTGGERVLWTECVGDTGMNVKRSKIDRIYNLRMEHDCRISAVNTVIKDHQCHHNCGLGQNTTVTIAPWREAQLKGLTLCDCTFNEALHWVIINCHAMLWGLGMPWDVGYIGGEGV